MPRQKCTASDIIFASEGNGTYTFFDFIILADQTVCIRYFAAWPKYENGKSGRALDSRVTMGFRGRGGMHGIRMPRGGGRFMYGRIVKGRNYQRSRPFEFKKLPESAKYKEFAVAPENIVCFSGFQNVFTAQHDFPVKIDGRVYDNVNHYYQLAKTEALCGVTSLLMTEGSEMVVGQKSKDYNTLAKNILKINKVCQFLSLTLSSFLENVDRDAAEEWRRTAGLEAMQRALLAKVEQCQELRKALLESEDKLLVHCFGGDDFYASGCNHKYIQDWARSMKSNKVQLKIPLEFPLTSEMVYSIPKFGLGRNVLGVIYIQLREMLRGDLLPFKGAVKSVSDEVTEDMQSDELTGPTIVPSVPAPLKARLFLIL
ncbi:unnamed protein product [Enterobius vermicularis]|uniref:DUF1768 domain-containing protein n=1 Tax=Enterobius vermicularis TaxID=51028 RepID=A0A0N4VB25_ENTVE|nr:unnamed protein product [Enterobius vermicularis]